MGFIPWAVPGAWSMCMLSLIHIFVLKISCASSDELERIHRNIKSLPGVSATRTHFVLKEIKNTYSAIPGEEAE